MRLLCAPSLAGIILAGSLTLLSAAGPSIGVAMASGVFRVNRSEVKGNASLFEGAEIATGKASSKLRINGGARLEIGTESQARVYADRAVIEKGAGQLESPSPYSLEARSIRISTADPKAIARVQLDGSDAVLVSAVNGPVRVTNGAGQLLARLAPGRNLRFLQTAQADTYEITGCLLKKGGKTIVVDQTTSQFFELRGADRSADFGNRVTVKGRGVFGATPVAGAAALIDATSVALVAPGGCLATASALGADSTAPVTSPGAQTAPKPAGPAGEGGANKAVIAGVVIGGGAAAGIGIALSGGNKSN